MDKRTLRSKKGKSRNARPYDRQNQSIFGKVCSTVKGLLNPSSWLNNVSHWISNAEEQHGGSLDDADEENGNTNSGNDVVSQSIANSSKRLRLRLDGHNYQDGPSIQSSETQTINWPEQPSQNLYEPIIVSPSSSATQSSLLENKEAITAMNGDDHSENSEGSASTSGCSSLVSSHKESNRLGERPFVSLLDVKNSRKRRETSPKSDYNDLNSSRGLWSSSFSPLKFQRRYPTVSHTNQPNFNLSSFAGPSRLNESSEKKTSSPFYEGKTTFGGASALRRMPASVVPYQVDRSLRNQIKVREQNSDDNLKRMSSAAERILLTLDKISSPVSDAKRIPNLNTSPVDLSVYLTPPKSRWNSQLTPPIASKGPPIANINTIAKLATLKNYGTSRLRSTPQGGSVTSAEQKIPSFDIVQSNTPEIISQKSAGGKMKNKLNQHHTSSKQGRAEHDVIDIPALKSIPLPITSLPTINFGSKPDKNVNSQAAASSFTFSKPIEHDLSVNNTVPTSTLPLHSPYDSFKFAHPIDYDLPNNSQLKEKPPSSTWECSGCWIQNPQSRTSCLACETPRETKETKSAAVVSSNSSAFQPSQSGNPSFQFGSQIPTSTVSAVGASSNFVFSKSETLNPTSSPAKFSFGAGSNTSPTWECSDCWIRNPQSRTSCLACEAPKETKKTKSVTTGSSNAILPSQNEKPSFQFDSQTTSTVSTIGTSPKFVFSKSNAPNQTSNSIKFQFGAGCNNNNTPDRTSSLTCETPKETKKINIAPNNDCSTWECSSCWIRNPMKEKKCMACETLHPNADLNSTTKDNSGFKFSSPLQNSPITFKFGNYVSTAPSTASTSTFKFGVSVTESKTTTTTSDFKFGTPNAGIFGSPAPSVTVSKSSEPSPATTLSSVSTGFKIPDIVLESGKTENKDISNNSEVSQTKSIFPLETKAVESVIESNNNCVTKNNVEDTVIKTKESAPEPEKNNPFMSNPLQLKESSKEKLPDAVITSSSSNVSTPSVTACFGFTTKPLESKDTKENKLPLFKLTNESPALSAFSSPANLFLNKSGEKVDFPKNNLSSASVTCTTTTATTSFSFSSNGSSFGTVTNPKVSEVTSTASNSHPVSVKTEGNKTVASTAVSSVTTSSPFVFGSSANTSVPSSFSFFPTSSSSTTTATASTATTSVFTFGASSNQPSGVTAPSNASAFSSFQPSQLGNPSFQFGSQTAASTASTIGTSTNFVFSKSEAPKPTTSSVSQSTGSAFGSTANNFVFGTKNEIAVQIPSTVSQPAGVTTVSSSNTPAFSTFQPTQSGNPSFQFGSQIPASTGSAVGASTNFVFSKGETTKPTSNSVSQSTVPAFGSTPNNFVFGAKNEISNQIPCAVSQASGIAFGSTSSFSFSNKNNSSDAASQKPPPPFGSSTMPTMPVFGNASIQPSFDGTEKPASGGFNFGTSSVFQFGAGSNSDKKRTATASGFSFGTPAASEPNTNSFPSGFSMNTPPSFNFGASSTPAGPFQFAASGAAAAKPAPTVNSGPRKIRKAVRRVNRGKD